MISPNTLVKGITTAFFDQYAQVAPTWEKLVTRVPSNSNEEIHNWLGAPPTISEWTGARNVQKLLEQGITVANQNWEGTLEIDRNDVEDDRTGSIMMRARQLGDRGARFYFDHLINFLINGDANVVGYGQAYDAQNFFSNSHSEGSSGTQDNLGAGTGTTVAQIRADLNAGVSAMLGFLDDKGEPYDDTETGAGSLALICPTGIYQACREAVAASEISNTTALPWTGTVNVIPSAKLQADDANDWYLLRVDKPIKPFGFQDRQPWKTSDTLGGDQAFHHRFYEWGVDARFAMFYAAWQYAYKVVNS